MVPYSVGAGHQHIVRNSGSQRARRTGKLYVYLQHLDKLQNMSSEFKSDSRLSAFEFPISTSRDTSDLPFLYQQRTRPSNFRSAIKTRQIPLSQTEPPITTFLDEYHAPKSRTIVQWATEEINGSKI